MTQSTPSLTRLSLSLSLSLSSCFTFSTFLFFPLFNNHSSLRSFLFMFPFFSTSTRVFRAFHCLCHMLSLSMVILYTVSHTRPFVCPSTCTRHCAFNSMLTLDALFFSLPLSLSLLFPVYVFVKLTVDSFPVVTCSSLHFLSEFARHVTLSRFKVTDRYDS